MQESREISVVEILPDLEFWARSVRPHPDFANELVEDTLELAIEHVEDLRAASNVRRWLFIAMIDIHVGRRQSRTRHIKESLA